LLTHLLEKNRTAKLVIRAVQTVILRQERNARKETRTVLTDSSPRVLKHANQVTRVVEAPINGIKKNTFAKRVTKIALIALTLIQRLLKEDVEVYHKASCRSRGRSPMTKNAWASLL
jgi:hypothetical protein